MKKREASLYTTVNAEDKTTPTSRTISEENHLHKYYSNRVRTVLPSIPQLTTQRPPCYLHPLFARKITVQKKNNILLSNRLRWEKLQKEKHFFSSFFTSLWRLGFHARKNRNWIGASAYLSITGQPRPRGTPEEYVRWHMQLLDRWAGRSSIFSGGDLKGTSRGHEREKNITILSFFIIFCCWKEENVHIFVLWNTSSWEMQFWKLYCIIRRIKCWIKNFENIWRIQYKIWTLFGSRTKKILFLNWPYKNW